MAAEATDLETDAVATAWESLLRRGCAPEVVEAVAELVDLGAPDFFSMPRICPRSLALRFASAASLRASSSSEEDEEDEDDDEEEELERGLLCCGGGLPVLL